MKLQKFNNHEIAFYIKFEVQGFYNSGIIRTYMKSGRILGLYEDINTIIFVV